MKKLKKSIISGSKKLIRSTSSKKVDKEKKERANAEADSIKLRKSCERVAQKWQLVDRDETKRQEGAQGGGNPYSATHNLAAQRGKSTPVQKGGKTVMQKEDSKIPEMANFE